jgi:hypothetical protein
LSSGRADSRLTQDGVPSKLCSTLAFAGLERMDADKPVFSLPFLHGSIGTVSRPIVIDARRMLAFEGNNKLIGTACRVLLRSPYAMSLT